MKLVKISDLSSRYHKESKPFMRITIHGTIWFSKCAIERLFLEDKSCIDIFQDKENTRDFYIRRGCDLVVHITKNSYAFCGHQKTVLLMKEVLGLDKDKNYSFLIATEPTQFNGEMFHAILTTKIY